MHSYHHVSSAFAQGGQLEHILQNLGVKSSVEQGFKDFEWLPDGTKLLTLGNNTEKKNLRQLTDGAQCST